MVESELAQALDAAAPPTPLRDGWERLGFLRNPFPTRSAPVWGVFHNQAQVRGRFTKALVEFVRDPTRTTTLFFTGGNRVGKTHFMEHHRISLPHDLNPRGYVLPIAVVSAEFADLERFFFSIVDQVADSLHLQVGAPLIGEPIPSSDSLDPGDFRRAMDALGAATGDEREDLRCLLSNWVRGDRLRQAQRKLLGVFGLVDSGSQVQNTFGGLVRYLRSRTFGEGATSRCPGILVFVDEFELIWRQRRDRRDQFLQGLRALVDVCATGGLFLCVGMATGLGPEVNDVEVEYPALYARLKGERDIPALLEIESGFAGVEYARAFETYGRSEFLKQHPDKASVVPDSKLFVDRDIDAFFREMVSASPGATVTQADFFDRLHNEAEDRRKTPAP